jgi:hypothetical protein
MSFHAPNEHRVSPGDTRFDMGAWTTPAYGNNGVFLVPPIGEYTIRVVCTCGAQWDERSRRRILC